MTRRAQTKTDLNASLKFMNAKTVQIVRYEQRVQKRVKETIES